MAEFFAELKRRHIYRVGAAYAVMAWLLLQIVNNVAPGLNLPNWAITLVIVLLALGFPVALLFCWIQHLPDGAAQQTKTNRLDWILVGGLATVIAIFLFQRIAQQANAPVSQAQSPQNGVSIAVLPFVNLSDDRAQEFFSDGITEEITAALARIPSLRVVARTSAFQFKGQNQDVRAVGQALGANHLIEGSVRKAGDRVRITAQLIKVDDGTHLWTDNYDRQLTDIFATQEDIAQAIAGALRVPLGLTQGTTLVSNRTTNVESYQEYLRAKALVRARGLKPLTDAAALLEQVVARDPEFAPAWAELAAAYNLIPVTHPAELNGAIDEWREVVDATLPKAEAAARRAIELNANYADGYVSLGLLQVHRGKLLAAEGLYEKAFALDPNNPDALQQYSLLLAEVGRLKDGLTMRLKLAALEPFVPVYNANNAMALWLNGQNDDAIMVAKALPPGNFTTNLATIYAGSDRYSEAAAVLAETPSDIAPATREQAASLLRAAPAPAASPQSLPRLGMLGFVYLHVGAATRALDYYEESADVGFFIAGLNMMLWHPSYTPVRKTERFKAFARAAGMVEYWRVKGWPAFCHPIGADDFVCD